MTFRLVSIGRLIFAVAFLSMAAPMDRLAVAQTGTACTCDDIYDLINRLNMAEAARAALLEELPKFEAADRASGKRSGLNNQNASGVTNQNVLRAAITKGMGSVQMPGYSSSGGRTDERCRPAVSSPTTSCMDEIVLWHETHVHVPACNDAPKSAIGFRAPMTTVDYIKEEIAGYESEIARIKEVLRMLPASCRPSGWIGHIQYSEDRTMTGQNTLPPTATRVSGSERTSHTLIRKAKVVYRESGAPTTVSAATASPKVWAEIEETYNTVNTGTMRRSCKGGLATPRFDGTTTGMYELGSAVKGNSEKDVDVGFDYDPATGRYTLSFEIPPVAGSGTQTRTENVSGACNPADDGTKSSSSQLATSYSGTRVSVTGTITQRSTTDVIQGNEKVNFGPPVSIPNLTITHSGTVRWTFFKLP